MGGVCGMFSPTAEHDTEGKSLAGNQHLIGLIAASETTDHRNSASSIFWPTEQRMSTLLLIPVRLVIGVSDILTVAGIAVPCLHIPSCVLPNRKERDEFFYHSHYLH
jgi:hypothetical protein